MKNAPDVVVAIPVFNGAAAVRECIESVVRHTHGHEIVIIDDCSTDLATLEVLDEAASHDFVRVIRNEENLGYTRTANKALAIDLHKDVVLLNSDTEVGPLWLERLRWTAYSRSNVASVSAVSDNAGAMAMPTPGVPNPWPESMSWTESARHVAQSITTFSLETPTAHGFCMYLRRDAVDAVGTFDEESFPRGYGEENDWSMRALAAGFSNLLAPHVFVRHAQGASFGESRVQLISQARGIVDRLHPSYRPLVGQWMSSREMAGLRTTFERLMAEADAAAPRPRTLYVIHASGGGTPETNRDLMEGLADVQESFLLVASERSVRLEKWSRGSSIQMMEWRPTEPFTLRDTWRPDYAEMVAEILIRHSIELIHIRHLINQPLTTVPRIASILGIPMILSTHDFYYICPTVHLLDQNLTFCGGVCTPGAGPCQLPTPFTRGAPNLKHVWIEEWKRRAASVLDSSRHVIATTPSAARIYAANYPRHADKLKLIEHGRDLKQSWDRLRDGKDRRPGPLRIACPAKWDPHKGMDYIRELVALTGTEVEWHILGGGSEFIGDGAVVHGAYGRDQLRTILDQIDPDFVGLFSIWPETYSHTLTEAWALGVPVIATDSGAVADRIRAHGGGVVFPVDDPSPAGEYLRTRARAALAGEPSDRAVPRTSIRSRISMAQDYAALYASVRESTSKPTIGYVVRGEGGIHPGSVHVRLRRRMLSRRASERFHFRPADTQDFISGADSSSYSAMIVQRDAIPAHLVDEFISACARRGVRFVFELDDDLLSAEAHERLVDQGYDPSTLESLKLLASAASTVIVSTENLARLVAPLNKSVVVVPNELDPRLWTETRPDPVKDPSGPLVALYMGSATHGEDLELVREVFTDLRAADGREIHLEVVGVSFADQEWHGRLDIPSGRDQYPRFVAWLLENSARWHIGIAPLADTSFNHAKSDLKFLEYTALGLPVVASAVGPYADLAQWGAITVPNDATAWRDAISHVVDDPDFASARLSQASHHLRRERLMDRSSITERWLSELDLAVGI